MVTKEQVMTEHEFHWGTCTLRIGPRGGTRLVQERWRANGRCHTWKTRPDEFSLPIKFGLREYSYITNSNADRFHAASDCVPVEERRR